MADTKRLKLFRQFGVDYFFDPEINEVREVDEPHTAYQLDCDNCESKERCMTIFLGFCRACVVK